MGVDWTSLGQLVLIIAVSLTMHVSVSYNTEGKEQVGQRRERERERTAVSEGGRVRSRRLYCVSPTIPRHSHVDMQKTCNQHGPRTGREEGREEGMNGERDEEIEGPGH